MSSRARRKPSEEHTRDLESQAAAHALANQQIAEEQQRHLLEEAAREAARIAAGATSPESGATPITPDRRDLGTEPAPGT